MQDRGVVGLGRVALRPTLILLRSCSSPLLRKGLHYFVLFECVGVSRELRYYRTESGSQRQRLRKQR